MTKKMRGSQYLTISAPTGHEKESIHFNIKLTKNKIENVVMVVSDANGTPMCSGFRESGEQPLCPLSPYDGNVLFEFDKRKI
jgi:hypothetical protein